MLVISFLGRRYKAQQNPFDDGESVQYIIKAEWCGGEIVSKTRPEPVDKTTSGGPINLRQGSQPTIERKTKEMLPATTPLLQVATSIESEGNKQKSYPPKYS